MASEIELEKIILLLQEVSDNECNNFDESSDSESDICEQSLENSDTEQSDNSDDDINSQVIFVSNNPDTKIVRRLFLRGLGLELLKPQVAKRVTTKNVPRSIRLEAAKYADIPAEKLQQSSSQKPLV